MRLARTVFFIIGLSFNHLIASEWTPNGDNIYFDGDKVGIGTTNPELKLSLKDGNIKITRSNTDANVDIYTTYNGSEDIQSGSFGYGVRPANDAWQIWEKHEGASWQNLFHVEKNGKIGIGTASPELKLSLKDGNIKITRSDTDANVDIYTTYNGSEDIQSGSFGYGVRPANDAWQIWEKHEGASWQNLFHVEKNGKVGIGTAKPTEKLDVDGNAKINGTLTTKKVIVTQENWPDYVFKKDYKLPKLEQVAKHIEEKQHLPEVPSAKEAESEGVSIGDMQKVLLKKIEELTLYTIQQEKRMNKQEELIQMLLEERK